MSVNEEVGHGTIKGAANFDAETDAGVLRKAMKGLGTDEDAIINLLVNRTTAQRVDIAKRFKLMYGKVCGCVPRGGCVGVYPVEGVWVCTPWRVCGCVPCGGCVCVYPVEGVWVCTLWRVCGCVLL